LTSRFQKKKQNKKKMQTVTPFEVNTESTNGVDYERLVDEFGLDRITPELLHQYHEVTGVAAHPLLTRGIFFAHRGLSELLQDYRAGKQVYIYTGRGPSGGMHIGHMIPFVLAVHLQQAFNATVVIQMTDDEKYHFSAAATTVTEIRALCRENIEDIMAMGFNPEKTFIFSNMEYMGHLYPNIVLLEKMVTVHKLKTVYGFDDGDAIGKFAHPCRQIVPCMSTSFPHLFPGNPDQYRCIIPCAVDQDPYFRQARSLLSRLGFAKPCLVQSTFLPGLRGMKTKMSSSDATSTIYLTDTAAQIRKKINKHAFSGGRETAALQRLHGANLCIDICYHYSRIFEPSDEKLQQMSDAYANGSILTGEYKKYVCQLIQTIISEHAQRKIR
jgi:tryptophanyl-tRNA synthetase